MGVKSLLESYRKPLLAARKEDEKTGGDRCRKRLAEEIGKEFANLSDPYEFQFGYLLESLIPEGREILQDYRATGETVLLEAGGAGAAVAFTDFSSITGQIVYSFIKEQLEVQSFLHNSMGVPSRFTPYQNGEKVPGIAPLGDDSETVGEGESYPRAKLSSEYIEMPATSKRGFIVDVTKEAVFGDRTGEVLQRAGQMAEAMGYEKEKRFLDLITGVSNSYNYNGNAIDTYGDSAGNHNWDNLIASNGLVDYTDIENAILAWDDMTHPITGEPIMPAGYDLLVPTDLVMTARNIINATEIEKVDNQANASTLRYTAANPLSGLPFTIRSNAYVSSRTASSTTWYIGDFAKAFVELYNWKMRVDQAPMNNHAEFERDIVASFKASDKSEYGVIEPRYVIKCTQ